MPYISLVDMVEREIRTRLGRHGLRVSVALGDVSRPKFAPDPNGDAVQLKAMKEGATHYFEFLKILPVQEIQDQLGPIAVACEFINQALDALGKIDAK